MVKAEEPQPKKERDFPLKCPFPDDLSYFFPTPACTATRAADPAANSMLSGYFKFGQEQTHLPSALLLAVGGAIATDSLSNGPTLRGGLLGLQEVMS